ncbi:MAG TPA: sigma 54-interacting transcriptional regulator [Chitinispirillaceae bacterium]|nr:sigma 54-interacting transcriptional regulator [Chitinispirillaceae bacterium]
MSANNIKYDPILDSIADGVFTVDNAWNITSFNHAAEQITGVTRQKAIGSKCWEIFHTEICERDCLLKKTIKSNKPCVNRVVRIIRKSGVSTPISISTAILRDESGVVIGGVETFRDLSELEELRKEVFGKNTHYDMVTRNHKVLDILDSLPSIATSDTAVLITGESGTGKELMAKAIHSLSTRKKGPFVALNCGALPENLLESELFGYKKGAFTDAKSDKPGRFDRAKGGTLFLDEIADLPKVVQVKLLRVLQEQFYEPLGSTEPVKSDVRIIAATNLDLNKMVESGEFRQDLFYRIHVMPLMLPPLRERPDDIPLLVEHFLMHFNTIQNRSIEMIDPQAMSILLHHKYPGNIRELENILQHAFVLCRGPVIEKKHFPKYLLEPTIASTTDDDQSYEAIEKRKLLKALETNRFNRIKTAKELGIHVATLWRKMKKYNIQQ